MTPGAAVGIALGVVGCVGAIAGGIYMFVKPAGSTAGYSKAPANAA